MENKATDLIAKLLANEDISIVHSNVSTASFQIDKRILTLPIWENMTPDLTGMLVGHEVGHALYTTTEYFEHEFKDEPKFHGYLNVLEDVRIEKFMKRRYPGLRKTFSLGYAELTDRDFFGVKNKDLSDINLIDRINLYFKAGFACGVSFTKKEKTYIERAEHTETIQDVIQLARELFELAKEESAKKQEDLNKDKTDEVKESDGQSDDDEYDYDNSDDSDDDQDDADDSDDDSEEDEQEQTEAAQKQYDQQNIDEDITASTDVAYQKKIEELSDASIIYKYWTVGKFNYNPLVPHTEIAKFFKGYADYYIPTYKLEQVEKFKSSSTGVVNYLVKEFEMKKAASMYKRTTISKTGQLDTRKLYNYKLSEDIFKRINAVKEGKNHGMLFLLDWSGSMNKCIDETIDQVINLAMFCRRAQIPFQVMAFSSQWANEDYKLNNPYDSKGNRTNTNDGVLNPNIERVSLLEFFSHKMTNIEFNNMVLNLKLRSKILSLGQTPLNESLVYMDTYINIFKNQHNVEKLTFITLTDGAGDKLRGNENMQSNKYVSIDGIMKMVKVKHFLVDPITKKNYEINGYHSSSHTNTLLNMIKDHHDVTILGFFLTGISQSSLTVAVRTHNENETNSLPIVARMKKEIREKGYASLKGTGRDDLFIIPLSSTKIIDTTLSDIDPTVSAASIAKKFGKMLNTKKTSRILLSNFIDYVA